MNPLYFYLVSILLVYFTIMYVMVISELNRKIKKLNKRIERLTKLKYRS